MSRRNMTVRLVGKVLFGTAMLAASSSIAGAQNSTRIDPRFQPWIGCWRAMDSGVGLEELDGEKQPTRACVVPSTTIRGTVDISLFYRDSLMSLVTIPTPGAPQSRRIDECEGTESAQWSSDDAHLILRAELSCNRGVKRVETGMMAMSSAGQWVQYQHLAVGKNEATTVARFRFEGDSALPAGLSVGSQRSSRALRLSTGAPVSAEAVIGVATIVPPSLAEAWLADLGQRFALDGKTLLAMSDNGVPPRVIDVLVALANPNRFQLAAGRTSAQGMSSGPDIVASRQGGGGGGMIGQNRTGRCDIMDDFCYGPGGMGAWGFGYRYGLFDPWAMGLNNPFGSRLGAWGYSPYSLYGFGNGFGNGWGNAWGNGVGFGGGPVVIVTNPGSGGSIGGSGTVRGRAVKGGGYTRSSPMDSRMGPSPSSSSSPSSSGSMSPASSGGSAGGGAGSGGDGGRTAKARPPGGI